ncbi:MAG: PTS sugar transporter subunit IIB [Elusimicrobia bacterium]|nr:PTS sugar transporter subunit IIB [Elusimicrobiota bacterium]
MPVVLVRIDDRLVHGQVVESWIPFVEAEWVLVVSDAVASDPTQRILMRLALPENVGLEVLSVEQAGPRVTELDRAPERVLILAPSPREVLALLRAGAGFQAVNVGGVYYSVGQVHLGKLVYLAAEDQAALQGIADLGITIEGQRVPSEKKINLAEFVVQLQG